jgi:chromosome segregation ATPase
VEQTARRIREERADFEAGQIRLKALRSVLARHEAKIRAVVGLDRLKGHVQETRERMRDSRLSLGLKEGMESLLAAARHDFYSLTHESGEVHALMAAMYARLGQENGLALGVPAPFPTQRFFRELDRIAGYRQRHFGARSLVLTEKWELTRRFLESVAVRLRALYELALRSAQVWLQSLMAPIDAQVREHELQFRQRLDAVQRILDAGGELKTRIEELRAERARIDRQLETLGEFADALAASLEMPVAQRLEPATF